VPFLVRWPGHVDANSSNDQLVCLNDIFATVAEILGQSLPEDAAGDSYSILPALVSGEANAPRKNMVHHSVHGEFAYREGPWKIVFPMSNSSRDASRGQSTRIELYHLDQDIGETTNVADLDPQKVETLTAALDSVILKGRSSPGPVLSNDVTIDFRTTQLRRWMALTDARDSGHQGN
jgi:arylsulfatase A-like enzyme